MGTATKQTNDTCMMIAKNLRYLSEKSGLHEAEICRRVGCPRATLNRLFRGLTDDPKISVIKRLADLFNVPMSSLVSDNLITKGVNTDFHMLPILEWDEVKSPQAISASLKKDIERNWVPVTTKLSEQSFVLKSPSAFEPRYTRDTLFIVDPTATPIDGDILILKERELNATTAKILAIDPPKWKLIPINGKKAINFKSDEHQIVGVVMEKRLSQARGT